MNHSRIKRAMVRAKPSPSRRQQLRYSPAGRLYTLQLTQFRTTIDVMWALTYDGPATEESAVGIAAKIIVPVATSAAKILQARAHGAEIELVPEPGIRSPTKPS
jgi:hypothetical protein